MTVIRWREGDRVLAPWEATWFYPGTIRSLDTDSAIVAFDDGDTGAIPIRELRRLQLAVGDLVQGRWNRGPKRYADAVVSRIAGDQLEIRYADGRVEMTTVSYLRIPRAASQVKGSVARPPVGLVPGQAIGALWREGDRVLAPWEPDWYYPGVIRCIDDDTIFIRFDDGGRALVPVTSLRPMRLAPGMRVFARRSDGPPVYHPATVLAQRGDALQLRFDDGLVEQSHVSVLRVPAAPAGR